MMSLEIAEYNMETLSVGVKESVALTLLEN